MAVQHALRAPFIFVASAAALAACGDDVTNPDNTNEQEVITTVTLTFVPDGGGATVVASFDDPDGEGGAAPTIDDITLTAGSTYAVSVQFLDKLKTPAEDITAEIEAEDDEHQLFFTGDAVDGPATSNPGAILQHSYADMDGSGFPIGLSNTIVARAAGTGKLTVTLRHLPEVGSPVKVAGLAEAVAAGGLAALPGDTDASVEFDVTVQ